MRVSRGEELRQESGNVEADRLGRDDGFGTKKFCGKEEPDVDAELE